MSESEGSTNVYEALPQVHPEAVVVYCGDPRLQTAFVPFIENELGLAKGQYIPVVVGGGAGVLANPERRPKEFKFLRDRFELFHRHFASLRRLVLINHEDCLYYRTLAQAAPGLSGPDSPHRPRDDLPPIARTVHRLLGHLGWDLELYYARFAAADRSQVAFDRVPF